MTEPLYPALDGPLRPRQTEAIDILAHVNSFLLDGGSLLGDEDEQNSDQQADPPPNIDDLCHMYGIGDVAMEDPQ